MICTGRAGGVHSTLTNAPMHHMGHGAFHLDSREQNMYISINPLIHPSPKISHSVREYLVLSVEYKKNILTTSSPSLFYFF